MPPDTCHDAVAPPAPSLIQLIGRQSLFLIGWACFAVGTVGLFLPLMPTTIFWIVAAWAWSKSCPRLQHKLYAVPAVGPHVRAWMENGTISRRGKQFALGGLSFGLAMSAFALQDAPVLLAVAYTLLVEWVSEGSAPGAPTPTEAGK